LEEDGGEDGEEDLEEDGAEDLAGDGDGLLPHMHLIPITN